MRPVNMRPVNMRPCESSFKLQDVVHSNILYVCNSVLNGAGTGSIERPLFPFFLHTSSDSSVGRAVDCSGIVIHRSLVQIRLRG